MITFKWKKEHGSGWLRFQQRFLEPTAVRLDPEENLRWSMLTAFLLTTMAMLTAMALNDHAPGFRRTMTGMGAVLLAAGYTLRWTRWYTSMAPILVLTVMMIPLTNATIGRLDPNDSLKWLVISMLTGGLWLTFQGTIKFFAGLLLVLALLPVLNSVPGEQVVSFLRASFPELGIPEWAPILSSQLAEVIIFVLLISGLVLSSVLFRTRAHDLISQQKGALEMEISERKAAQEDLQKHKDHLEELVEERTAEVRRQQQIIQGIMNHSPAVIYVKDEEGRYKMANKRFLEMFKQSGEELPGKTDHGLFRRKEADEYRKNDLEVLAAGRPIESEETAFVDGVERHFISQKFPIRVTDTEVLIAGISTDITRRKMAEESLRVANKEIRILNNRLQDEITQLQEEIDHKPGSYEIVGEGKAIRSVYARIDNATSTDSTVLISGETGTGKELIARAIHKNSPRASKPFVTVDCTSLPETLVESELFGHEKGAFTGAVARKLGKFEAADGGTVFLDEIGEMRIEMQARLLRVLNDKTFTRVGGTSEVMIDVRVIAATNRSLEDEVREGRFREDLFYRLNVVTIKSPPLRERKEDIKRLAMHFVEKYRTRFGKGEIKITQASLDDLMRYNWPGNVRQLEHTIEGALNATKGGQLNLSKWRQDQGVIVQESNKSHGLFELRHLRDATNGFREAYLKKHVSEWCQTQRQLAERLGVRDTHLSKLLRDYDIEH